MRCCCCFRGSTFLFAACVLMYTATIFLNSRSTKSSPTEFVRIRICRVFSLGKWSWSVFSALKSQSCGEISTGLSSIWRTKRRNCLSYLASCKIKWFQCFASKSRSTCTCAAESPLLFELRDFFRLSELDFRFADDPPVMCFVHFSTSDLNFPNFSSTGAIRSSIWKISTSSLLFT